MHIFVVDLAQNIGKERSGTTVFPLENHRIHMFVPDLAQNIGKGEKGVNSFSSGEPQKAHFYP